MTHNGEMYYHFKTGKLMELWAIRAASGIPAPSFAELVEHKIKTEGSWGWPYSYGWGGETASTMSFICRASELWLEGNLLQLAVDEIPKCCRPHGLSLDEDDPWNYLWL